MKRDRHIKKVKDKGRKIETKRQTDEERERRRERQIKRVKGKER